MGNTAQPLQDHLHDDPIVSQLRLKTRYLISGCARLMELDLSRLSSVSPVHVVHICPYELVDIVFQYLFDANLESSPFLTAIHYGYLSVITSSWSEHKPYYSREGLSTLKLAAKLGHYQTVNWLISNGVDVNDNGKSVSGETALGMACIHGHHRLVQELLKWPNIITLQCANFGESALVTACKWGHIECVKLLLSHNTSKQGSSEGSRHVDQTDALLVAIRYNRIQIVSLLIESDVDINVQKGRTTPLMTAMNLEDLSIARLLLQKGANPHIRNDRGRNIVMREANKGHIRNIRMLYEYFDAKWSRQEIEELFNAGDCKMGWTPLHLASKQRYGKVVKYLVETVKVNVFRRNKKNRLTRDNCGSYQSIATWLREQEDLYLLEFEGKMKHHGRVFLSGYCKRLMMKRAESSDVMDLILCYFHDDSQQKTPFMRALRLGYFSLTKELWPSFKGNFLEYGSAAKKAMERGHTPLWTAARKGNIETVLVFLCCPADVDIDCKDNDGITPLWIATRNGHSNVVELLLNPPRGDVSGANPNISSKNGETPLWVAASLGHMECARHLIDSGADIEQCGGPNQVTPLFVASQNGYHGVVQVLVAVGANIDALRQSDGTTPLMTAAYSGHAHVVRFLLRKQANLMHINKSGLTVLSAAAMNGHVNVIQVIWEHLPYHEIKEFVNRGNRTGLTALHFACMNGHKKVVEYLVGTMKVDLSRKDQNNKTALQLAAANGNVTVAACLRARCYGRRVMI